MDGDAQRAADLAQRALVGTQHPSLRAVLELLCAVPAAKARRDDEVAAVLSRIGPELEKVRPMDVEVTAALAALRAAVEDRAPPLTAAIDALLAAP